MTRALTLLVCFIVLVGTSCTQKLICPAYQSSFIYDKEALRKKFSYFKEDSTPKILTASKTKYLVAVPESYQDSVYTITKTKEQYNVDQDIYMWYFRDQLVLPDVRAAMETQSQNKAKAAKATKKKKGIFSFLKFGKKKKANDSTAVEETPLIPTDSDTTAAPPKKKGIMGLFGGKNKKKDPAAPEKKKDPAKKDEDDGF
jgi:hypothetical protein